MNFIVNSTIRAVRAVFGFEADSIEIIYVAKLAIEVEAHVNLLCSFMLAFSYLSQTYISSIAS